MSIFYCLSKRKRWLLLLLVLLSLQSKAFTQDSSRITVQGNNIPIETALRQIEKQSGFSFVYGKPTLDDTERITVDISGKGFTAVMDALLGARGIVWSFRGGAVVLSRRGEDVKNLNSDSIPKLSLTGKVVDVVGKALSGATIIVKGKGGASVADGDGVFRLFNIALGSTIVVSRIGYETKQIRFTGSSSITIQLDYRVTELNNIEVVSTGYQSIPKERATGSFVELDNELINRTVSTTITDRILNVTSSLKFETIGGSGGLNSSNISIRGFSTINANMKPLIVVDGFPYEEDPLSPSVILNNLNPNDIENITILRDAAAASIWGARAGNGVIVITTKKGGGGRKANVQFNANVNFVGKPDLSYLKIISPYDAVDFERKVFSTGVFNDYDDLYPSFNFFPSLSPAVEVLLAQRRNDISQVEADRILSDFSNHDVRDDIEKYFLRTAVNQQYSLSVSGGSEKISYYGSIGYDKNLANSKNSEQSRFTMRLNNIFKPIKDIELTTYIVATQNHNKLNDFNYASLLATGDGQAAPYTMLIDANGVPLSIPRQNGLRTAYTDTVATLGLLDWAYRPLEEMDSYNNRYNEFSTRIGGSLKYEVVRGMSVEFKGQYERAIGGYTRLNNIQTFETRNLINSFMYNGPNDEIIYPIPIGDVLDLNETDRKLWDVRGQVNVDRGWGDHQISLVAAVEGREASYSYQSDRKYGYNLSTSLFNTSMDYNTVFALRPSGSARISSNEYLRSNLNRFISYLGNMGYTFKERYSITASGRVDKSNFFGAKANQRFIPLWSTGIGWDVSKELFYNVRWLPYLKMRATYGYNGNLNNLGTSLPTATFNQPGSSVYHNELSLSLRTPPNPGLTWEKVGITNIGVDFGSRNNRISGSLEYYNKKGVNLIGPINVEYTVGATTYTGNYGNMKGEGLDLIFRSTNLDKNVKWNSSVNLSYNTDKITKYNMSNPQNSINYMSPTYPKVGKPLVSLYGFPSGQLNPTNGSPMGYLKGELTDFAKVLQDATPDDLEYVGSATPQIFGNLINIIEYKHFSFSFNILFRFKYYFRRSSISYSSLYSNWGGHSDYAKRWQRPGDEEITVVPSLPEILDTRDQFYLNSTSLIERGDHIRLQDMRLAYTFQRSKLKKSFFSGAKVYVYFSNLGILWKATDEDTDPAYFFSNSIPPSKSVALGFNVGF